MLSLVKTAVSVLLAQALFGLPIQAQELSGGVQKAEKEAMMQIVVKSTDREVVFQLNESKAARDFYGQLPLTVKVKPFSTNEIIFYPPKALRVDNTPHSNGKTGSLSYYEPWGNVVMFYAPCHPNASLYELGSVVSGVENISKLSGEVTVSRAQESK